MDADYFHLFSVGVSAAVYWLSKRFTGIYSATQIRSLGDSSFFLVVTGNAADAFQDFDG